MGKQVHPGGQSAAKEEQILCGHLLDLANACYQRDRDMASDFLTLHEQDIFLSFCVKSLPPVEYKMLGGYEEAERKIVYFQPIGAWNQNPAPLVLLEVKQKNKRFAQELTHRDYLGTLMSLGIDRSKIGDILVAEDGCQIICQKSIADVICEELTKIRHTDVVCSVQDLEMLSYRPKSKRIEGTVASVRLDAVIGLAFSESRSKLVGYIEGEKVFVNGKCITSNAYSLQENDLVSVRGLGKFRFCKAGTKTKKGRIVVMLDLFI